MSEDRLTYSVQVRERGSGKIWDITGQRNGRLLLATWHTSQSSAQMECDIWEKRGHILTEGERP